MSIANNCTVIIITECKIKIKDKKNPDPISAKPKHNYKLLKTKPKLGIERVQACTR